jgi:hypothetical protein
MFHILIGVWITHVYPFIKTKSEYAFIHLEMDRYVIKQVKNFGRNFIYVLRLLTSMLSV